MERSIMSFISDARGDRERSLWTNRDTVWSNAGLENGPRFQSACIDPSQGRRSAVGYKNVPIIGGNARSFRKARQSGDVSTAVVIDHFDAVPTRVRHENAAALGVEGTMIEGAA